MGVAEEDVRVITETKNYLGVRHMQMLMVFLSLLMAQCTRTTMSLAIVDMIDPANENYFNWTLQRQSVILSSFAWGYVSLQSVTGELTRKFGGMTLLVVCIGVGSVFSLLLPAAAIYGGWILVCVCRGIQGLVQGTIIPTITYLLAKWVPLKERSRVSSFVLSGSYLGIALQFVTSGYIADYWGWPTIFYLNGVAGLVWTIIYLLIGSDSPQDSKLISTDERFYIQSSLGQIGGHKKLKTPWKSIFTSLPFFATLIANVGFSWGYWTLLTEIPTYMSKILHVDIKSNGVMSALPYIAMFAMNFPVGSISDYIISKNWVSVTTCRKIFNSFGFFGAAASLIWLTCIPAGSMTLAVVALCVALGFKSGYYGGFIVAYLDMTHNFTSTLVAIANFTANFVGLFAPLFAGFVVKDENDPEEWKIVFYLTAATYIVTNMIFVVFASSEEQKWNQGTEIESKNINKV